ncbi:MAG: BON domain-containing protein [Isosphaeraceae bacterium]|jgi:osmotically-inducible protein OsmY
MKKIRRVSAAVLFGLSLVLATGSAVQAQEQDTGKKVGQQLDELGRTIKKGLKSAGDSVRQQFTRARAAVHDMNVTARVYSRLHWEKCLNTSDLDLEVKGDVVTLRGAVPDAKAKAKAIELASETVGVKDVKDQLTIATPHTNNPDAASTAPRRP